MGRAKRQGWQRKSLWLVALLVAAGTGFYYGLWKDDLKHELFPRRWGVVEPGRVYRSGQISERLIEPTLAKHGIRVVIDLTTVEMDDPEQVAELRAIETLGIERHKLPLRGDGTGDVARYAEAIAVLDRSLREGKPVLVHCSAGTNRTGGVLAAWQLLVQRHPPDAVYREMTRYGWDRRRNPELLAYLNENLPALADRLVELGVIDAAPQPLPHLEP